MNGPPLSDYIKLVLGIGTILGLTYMVIWLSDGKGLY